MTNSNADPPPKLAPEALRSAQVAAAGAQSAYAAKNSPYYRELLQASTSDLDFASISDFATTVPWVNKDMVIARQRDEPPYGGWLAVPEGDIVRHYVYPTGQVLAWSRDDLDMLLDQYADGLRVGGVTREDKVDITFQYAWVAAGTIWDAAAQHLGAAVAPGGAGESDRHAVNLRLLQSTCMIGFASFLQRIGEAALEQGIDPAKDLAIRKLVIVGEQHGSDAKARLAAQFGGATVREAYGTVETGLVAVECEADPDAMHVHEDFLIETRDPLTGDEVESGAGGELFITPLRLRAMPVLRYRTGDVSEFVRFDRCACGRATPRMGRIVGRVGQYLRVKGVFLNRTLFETVLQEAGHGYGPFHLEVDRPQGLDRLRLSVEAPPETSEETRLQMVKRLKQRGSVAVDVIHCAPGTIAADAPWFTDRRMA